MNILVSEKLFDQLVTAARDLAEDLGEAQHYCTLQEDIDLLGKRVDGIGALVNYCARVKAASKHGRHIKGQLEELCEKR